MFTRRGQLKVTSSVFDPLGMVCPFVLLAKLIFQEECRTGKGWDDEMEPDNVRKWKAWLEDANKLESYTIPQYLQLEGMSGIAQQSCTMYAYRAVAYLRVLDSGWNIHYSFVMAKSRLSPNRQVTIPRLELCGAVCATNLCVLVQRELPIKLDAVTYWTDSAVVLQYIKNAEKRFHMSVANRVATVLDQTSPMQWFYTNTRNDSADDASRSLKVNRLLSSSKWSKGPAFSGKTRDCCPRQPAGLAEPSKDEPEVRKEAKTCVVAPQADDPIKKLTSHYSHWLRIRKAVAWMRRLADWICSKKCQAGYLP